MARNFAGLNDGDGNSPDWIELYNQSDARVDLEGYRLTDDATDRSKWVLPRVILDPAEYVVVLASGQETANYLDAGGYLHTNFKLKRSGEYLALVAPDGEVVSEFAPTFPEQRANVSYGMKQQTKLVDTTSDVMFRVPVDGSSDATWTQLDFDALGSGFSPGKAAVGYESAPDDPVNFSGQFQTQLRARSHAVYVRISFDLNDASAVSELNLRLKYDNGFIAYLNGVKVAQDNAPETSSWFSSAPKEGRRDWEALQPVDIDVRPHLDALVDGRNVLAIHGFNHIGDITDMLLVPELIGVIPGQFEQIGYMPSPTPGEANDDVFSGLVADTQFSVDRGFYDTPQQVEITTETVGAQIYYTTNGSDPGPFNAEAALYTAPVSVTKTTTVRAAAFKSGLLPTNIDTHTYVFVNDVHGQSDMRATITGDPVWGPQMRESLLAIPSVSLVTPHTVSEGQTIANETGASVEMIFHDGTEGFQVDAGMEHFGGHTQVNLDKKNIRLSFKSIYGPPALRYDLFGDGATDQFDQLLLRTGSHDSWFWAGVAGDPGIYIRNKWANDRQLQMGQPAPHGRFVHVYINGTYWGLHHLMERPNAAFMASYFGGDKEDYDALKPDWAEATGLFAVDGDYRAWEALRGATGSYEELKQYLDVENYADYMLLHHYAGNDDDWIWNWMAARKRQEGARWKFFSWDSDMILRTGVDANVFTVGGPGNLWHDIIHHEEFRMLLADRAQKYFFDRGMLTPERVLAQFADLADQIRLPIIAESARWTGSNESPAYTPETWRTNVERVRGTIVAGRTDVVLRQMRQAGLFPDVKAPSFFVGEAPQHGGLVSRSSELTMSAPQGAIYYTLDGTDPRLVGGEISPDAKLYAGPVRLDGTETVKSRALHDGQWSALREATFQRKSDFGLRITEINYSPLGANQTPWLAEASVPGDAIEFVEFTSVADETIDLKGVQLVRANVHGRDQGIEFQFASQMLEPGERVVVVRDRIAFQSRYGEEVRIALGDDGAGGADGQYGGKLSNVGERLTLLDARGTLIHEFDYGVTTDWPERASGRGSSLEIINTDGNYNDPHNWRSSTDFGGSPGVAETQKELRVVINEVLANTNAPGLDMIELYNTTDETIDISNWYISDSHDNYFRFQVTTPTVIPAGGYQVLTEEELGIGFDGPRGGELWLIAADHSGRPVAFVDHVTFGPSGLSVSLGRWPNGEGPLFSMVEATFGRRNSGRRVGDVIISEVHFSPLDPDRPTLNVDDFEFIEIYNRSRRRVDLSGWRLSGSIEFTFDPGTTIAPAETLVVVPFHPNNRSKADVFRFFLDADPSVRMLGPFQGQLDDSGNSVRLEQREIPPPDDPTFMPFVVIDEIEFRTQPPWPVSIAESGDSLTRIRANSFGSTSLSWTAKTATPGTVKFVEAMPGDTNEDAVFNQLDIVLALQGGKYLIGELATWSDGDWNGDGVFDQIDLIAALDTGRYLQGSSAALTFVE